MTGEDAESGSAVEQEERTPTHCPSCGHDGAMDGLGHFSRSATIKREDSREHVRQSWSYFHCTACDDEFAILESEVKS